MFFSLEMLFFCVQQALLGVVGDCFEEALEVGLWLQRKFGSFLRWVFEGGMERVKRRESDGKVGMVLGRG